MADTHPADNNKKNTFWDSTMGTITKITAFLSAVTALIVAINQLKTTPHNPSPVDVPNPSAARAVQSSVVSIDGGWRDVNNPANGSQITQQGNSFQFQGWGILPQGIQYKSTGSGTITGQTITSTYTTTYQNGSISQGTCSGTISADGLQMTLTFTDNVLGTFVSSAVRQ